MKLDTYVNTRGRATCIYGPPKVGKTLLAGMLAEHFNIWWFDLENGITTVQTQVPKEWQARIEYISIPDTKANPIAIDTMLKVFTGGPVQICDRHGAVGCTSCMKAKLPSTRVCLNELNPQTDLVVVDSGSQLSDSAYNKLCGDDPYRKMEWGDWHNQNQLMAMILSAAQQAHYNSLFISHEIESENEDGTKQIFPIFSTRNFSSRSAKFFANVVYCQVKMGKYSHGASADFNTKVVAGNRVNLKLDNSHSLADLIRNPDAVSFDESRKLEVSAGAKQEISAPQTPHEQPQPTKTILATKVSKPTQIISASGSLKTLLAGKPSGTLTKPPEDSSTPSS